MALTLLRPGRLHGLSWCDAASDQSQKIRAERCLPFANSAYNVNAVFDRCQSPYFGPGFFVLQRRGRNGRQRHLPSTHPATAPARPFLAAGWARLSGVSDALRLPIPRQQFVNSLGRVIRQASQDVGKPSLWINVAELGGSDEGVDRGRTPAALIGAGESPISSSHGDGP